MAMLCLPFHETIKAIEGDDKSALAAKTIVKTTNMVRRTFHPAHGEEVTN
jgi:hypothetical protein